MRLLGNAKSVEAAGKAVLIAGNVQGVEKVISSLERVTGSLAAKSRMPFMV